MQPGQLAAYGESWPEAERLVSKRQYAEPDIHADVAPGIGWLVPIIEKVRAPAGKRAARIGMLCGLN